MRLLRTGLLVVVLVLAAALLGALVLGGDWLFASALRGYGPSAIGQPLDFAGAELSVLAGSAGIDELLVGTREHPVLAVRRAGVNASPLALLSGRLHVEEAVLEGSVVHLVIDERGQLNLDPGPPPAEVTAAKPPRERPRRRQTPPAERDFVQIVQEYWERLQDYSDYYDKAGGVFGGEDDPEAAAERAAWLRAKHPGRASFLGEAEADAGPSFWLGHAALEDFRWETVDLRTGQPILPPLERLSLSIDRLGAAPAGETGPTTIAGQGAFAAGGSIDFELNVARAAEPSGLRLTASGLPVAAVAALVTQSLPYELTGGLLDLQTRKLRFATDRLEGKVIVTLREVVLKPKPDAPEVLGLKPREFCRLLNEALARAPVALDFMLGGTPTAPTFEIDNQGALKDLLTGAVEAEAKNRLEQLLDDKPKKRRN